MPKKREYTDNPVTKCVCGSTAFSACFTIQIMEAPVWFGKDATMSYDDTKGDSQGWDTAEEPEICCAKCQHIYHLEQLDDDGPDGRPRYTIVDMQPDKTPPAPQIQQED